jgi:hypothetical protein
LKAFVGNGVLFNPCGEMASSFTNVAGITSRTREFINHIRFKKRRNRILETKKIFNFKR